MLRVPTASEVHISQRHLPHNPMSLPRWSLARYGTSSLSMCTWVALCWRDYVMTPALLAVIFVLYLCVNVFHNACQAQLDNHHVHQPGGHLSDSKQTRCTHTPSRSNYSLLRLRPGGTMSAKTGRSCSGPKCRVTRLLITLLLLVHLKTVGATVEVRVGPTHHPWSLST